MGKGLALAATMAAIVVPGGSSASAASPEAPASSPEIFNECAQLATAEGADRTIGIEASTVEVDKDAEEASFTQKDRWEGPIRTSGGTACKGMIRIRTSHDVRSGYIRESLGWMGLGFSAQDPEGIKVGGGPSFSYKSMCRIAREIQGKSNPVLRLTQTDTRSYSEPGYPTVTTTDTSKLAKLPCASS
jgi:hypothetical protein